MTSLFIVEDDSHFRGELTRELEGRGFQVASAPSVHSALAALSRHPADVVLTDLRLGGPDGLDLLKLLPSVSRRTRSILMSAHASARDHQVATELGAVDVLLKPFTSAELLRSIHKAIGSTRSCTSAGRPRPRRCSNSATSARATSSPRRRTS